MGFAGGIVGVSIVVIAAITGLAVVHIYWRPLDRAIRARSGSVIAVAARVPDSVVPGISVSGRCVVEFSSSHLSVTPVRGAGKPVRLPKGDIFAVEKVEFVDGEFAYEGMAFIGDRNEPLLVVQVLQPNRLFGSFPRGPNLGRVVEAFEQVRREQSPTA